MQHADAAQAAREMQAQVDRVFAMGLRPTHLDAHMGSIYFAPGLFTEAVRLARLHNLVIPFIPPEQKPALSREGFVSADTFGGFYVLDGEEHSPHMRKEAYFGWMKALRPGVHYLYTHAASVTPELARIVEMPYVRSGDKEVWTSSETRALAKGLGVTFIGMRALQELQGKNFRLTPGVE